MKCTACQEVDTGGTLGSGLSRRDFMKVCTAAAVYMGLDASFGAQIAEAATAKRLPVIWISGQDCTGCTETLLRATHPTLEHLILDLISLDYHETLQSGCGKQANEALDAAINAGGYVLVAEGSFPTKDGGIYCKINGEPVVDILAEGRQERGGLHRDRLLLLVGRHAQRRPEPDRRAERGRDLQDEGPRQARGDEHPRLPAQPLQLPLGGAVLRDLRQAPRTRRTRAARSSPTAA